MQRFDYGAAVAIVEFVERLTLKEIHDEEKRPIVEDAVVADGDNATMVDAVGSVRFVQKALPNLWNATETSVQHLERSTVAIAVRGFVHRGHATQPKKSFQAPLIAKHLSFALSRQEIVSRSEVRMSFSHSRGWFLLDVRGVDWNEIGVGKSAG
jgi:hypothetical protein